MDLNFKKSNNLIPVVIQDSTSLRVLMLGYMNPEAFEKTKKEKKVTFYSRSKQRLWTKGETSGNYLLVDEILEDCDSDTLLIKVFPQGPTCHTGNISCFKDFSSKGFLYKLEETIHQKIDGNDPTSYTAELFKKGINKVAQKVGEEAVEVLIEAKDNNEGLFLNESADLLYHFLILLKFKKLKLKDVEQILESRQK